MSLISFEIISRTQGSMIRNSFSTEIPRMKDKLDDLIHLKPAARQIVDTLITGGTNLFHMNFNGKESWININDDFFDALKMVSKKYDGKGFTEEQYAVFLLRNLINSEADLDEEYESLPS